VVLWILVLPILKLACFHGREVESVG